MIRPRRDRAIALALLAVSIPVFLNGLRGMSADEAGPRVAAGMAAALVGLFSALMALNFHRAVRIADRLARGEGVVARWTVPEAAMAAFLRAEARRARNHWRPRPGPAEIVFGAEAVLAGDALMVLPSAGLQSFRALTWIEGEPPVLEFATETVTRTGSPSAPSIGTIRGVLRVPVTDRRAGSVVRRHFDSVLAGRTIVEPGRWVWRIRLGLWAMVAAALSGLAGWALAESVGWRGDDPAGLVALVLMISAPLVGLGGLIIALAAWSFHRRQQGR